MTKDEARVLKALGKAGRAGAYTLLEVVAANTGLSRDRVNVLIANLRMRGFVETLPNSVEPTDAITTSLGRVELERINKAKRNSPGQANAHREVRTPIRLFISHSNLDKDVADGVSALLATALHLRVEEIRCSSVDAYKLPGGAKTESQLRQEVAGTSAFIAILSPQSLASTYVLFEIGARWGLDREFVPLLAPGFDAKRLNSPLKDRSVLHVDNAADLHRLVRQTGDQLGASPQGADAYQRHVDHLQTLPLRREPEFTPRLTLYIHASAQKTPEHTLAVKRLFAESGWTIEPSVTNLPQHANGVFLIGGSHLDRIFAKWGLQTIGISATVEYQQPDPPVLQVVVGAVHLERSATTDQTPTIEMLEQNRRELHVKREQLIASWREMVRDVHEELRNKADFRPLDSGAVAAVLERHRSFLTFRPHMSTRTYAVLYYQEHSRFEDMTLSSTLASALHDVLSDVEHLEREWRLI